MGGTYLDDEFPHWDGRLSRRIPVAESGETGMAAICMIII
jgi:hypothetical protein